MKGMQLHKRCFSLLAIKIFVFFSGGMPWMAILRQSLPIDTFLKHSNCLLYSSS